MTEATSGQASTDTATATPAASAPTPAASAPAPAAAPAAVAPAASAETPAQATPATETTAEPAKPAGAPEKYEFKPTEGIKFDDKVIGKYAELAKELNLTQEGAQKVLSEVAPLIAQQQADAFKATREAWVEATKGDKEIGGEKLTANLALAAKARDAYFTPEFVKLLNSTGLGDHPEMIRGFAKIGKSVSQDSFVGGGSGPTPHTTAAERLYGSK